MGRFYDVKGRKLVSVTTFLQILGKPFLVPWAAKMERAARKQDGAYAYMEYMQESANWGSKIHAAIEWYFKRKGKRPTLSKAQQVVMKGFVKWWKNAGYDPLDVELVVYDLDEGYAGTLDLRAKSLKDVFKKIKKKLVKIREKGKIYIVDWKTGKGIWPEHKLQNVAYRSAAAKMKKPSDGGILVHIPHDGSEPVEVPVDVKNPTMKEVKAALHLWKWAEGNR